MSLVSHFIQMFTYVAWANRRTSLSIRNTPVAWTETLPLLGHLVAAEHVWLQRILGETAMHQVWPTLDLEQCEQLATENHTGYQSHLQNETDSGLLRLVEYTTSRGDAFSTPVLDIMLQVITHGPYHRGQIAKIIAKHGGTPLNTDYITFVREHPWNQTERERR